MPRYQKKRYRRKRAPQSRSSRYLGTASKALSVAYAVKKLLNVEYKKYDLNIATTPSTAGSTTHISSIAQGDAYNQRNGNSIKMVSLNVRYTIKQNVSATNTFVRVMIVRDTQQISDTTPNLHTAGVMLENTSVNSFLENDSLGRFSILYDKVHALAHTGNTKLQFNTVNIPMSSHIRYNGAAATDIQKSGLYLVTFSDEATLVPSLGATTRMTYLDN